MAKEEIKMKMDKVCCGGGTTGAFYGIGFVGALVYFLQQATTIEMGLVGIVKAIIWPALLVYKALGLLGM